MRDLDSSLLRAFLTVAECGTVSAAAQKLNRTQSTVSMQLKRLEEDVHQKLFDRSPRGLRLTEPGEVLFGYALQALSAGMAARQALAGNAIYGTVRIGVIEDIAVGRLIRSLSLFNAIHPGIQVDVVVGCSDELLKRLGSGDLQIIIGDKSDYTRDAVDVWHHQMVWVAPRGFELDPDVPLPLILYDVEAPCSWRDDALAVLKDANLSWRVAFSASSLGAISIAVKSGLGVSMMIKEAANVLDLTVVGVNKGLPSLHNVEIGLYVNHFTGTDNAAVSLVNFLVENWAEVEENHPTKQDKL